MTRSYWFHAILVAIVVLIVILVIRMHGAAGQVPAQPSAGDAESGHFSAEAWCTECHSVEPETAGIGKFAPDFTVIAKRRSARWLHAFLLRKHTLMPDFVFNQSGADDIVAYIMSLKRK
jgi:mono/diheme cytochrome c family protein